MRSRSAMRRASSPPIAPPSGSTISPGSARKNGFKVIIAGAGGAAHLPGMAASMTPLPVFGVPMNTHALEGKDSLLSIMQMPGGIPVGTLAIGKAGAINAALLAAAVLALSDAAIAKRLDAWRARADQSRRQTAQRLNRVAETRRDHRHSRRRPARPHACARRGAAGFALSRLFAGKEFLRLRRGARRHLRRL